jgi:PHD/YefM family antitoxin component YafN of YafNO toxin-antitoxin module
MLQTQCISVTDLRTKTKECLENLEKEPKYVFINNRPIAVLIDINRYEQEFRDWELQELPLNKVDKTLKRAASRAKKSARSDLINI